MKKLLLSLLIFPTSIFASETGESCAKIEDGAKRLECYDGIFVKKESNINDVKSEKSKWEYNQETDELRNQSVYLAKNISTNTVNFGFPYDNSSMVLILRKDPKYGKDVIFDVNGQFSDCFERCNIIIKFDDGNLERYRMVGSENGDNSTIFISSSKEMTAFVNKLKKSKKLIVEASFYNYGKGQFTFDVSGLNWKHF